MNKCFSSAYRLSCPHYAGPAVADSTFSQRAQAATAARMPEHNLFAVLLSTIFFGFLSLIMKKVDEVQERMSLRIEAALRYDRPDPPARECHRRASPGVRKTRRFGIENRIRAAYDSRDPQSSRVVCVTPPGVAFRLERPGHRSSLALLGMKHKRANG